MFSYKIIVGFIHIMLLFLMPVDETSETRVRTDCLDFDVSAYKLKNKFQFEERGIVIVFFVGF